MSDDELDPELIAAFRQSQLAAQLDALRAPEDTGVLDSAKFICDNSIDVALDMQGTKSAAEIIYQQMKVRDYSPKTWSEHELHPKTKDESTVNFIFTLDLLNFSFWSEKSKDEMYAVEYQGRKWTGYWSLVAALQRALDEGIRITDNNFWHDEEECTEEVYKHVFRSATDDEMPMLKERIVVLQEAAEVLCKNFDSSILNLLEEADHSAAALVNLLAEYFPSFRDECKFEGRKVRFLKRAQIFVADLWAAFEGESYGEFHDIEKITMFADYRVPQMLNTLDCLVYSPPLEAHIRKKKPLDDHGTWEIELRGCSIWCVEMLRREIIRQHPDAENINAILIDFFLYDTIKELEATNEEPIPHHRRRSIFY